MNALLTKAQQPLNVMTFNIRLNIAVDSLNAWPYRKDIAASQILLRLSMQPFRKAGTEDLLQVISRCWQ